MARRRPEPTEYNEFYAGYVAVVPEGDILDILGAEGAEALATFEEVSPGKLDYRYEPGKWTAREVVGHILDAEWIFTYRALRFARGDATPLPGMDQDEFMAGANFGERDMASMIAEFRHLRAANRALFGSFGEDVLDRSGTASGCSFTVRGLLYIVAGHAIHHVRVLRERYLG